MQDVRLRPTNDDGDGDEGGGRLKIIARHIDMCALLIAKPRSSLTAEILKLMSDCGGIRRSFTANLTVSV